MRKNQRRRRKTDLAIGLAVVAEGPHVVHLVPGCQQSLALHRDRGRLRNAPLEILHSQTPRDLGKDDAASRVRFLSGGEKCGTIQEMHLEGLILCGKMLACAPTWTHARQETLGMHGARPNAGVLASCVAKRCQNDCTQVP